MTPAALTRPRLGGAPARGARLLTAPPPTCLRPVLAARAPGRPLFSSGRCLPRPPAAASSAALTSPPPSPSPSPAMDLLDRIAELPWPRMAVWVGAAWAAYQLRDFFGVRFLFFSFVEGFAHGREAHPTPGGDAPDGGPPRGLAWRGGVGI